MTDQPDTLAVRFECSSPWRSALLWAFGRLARGHGWEIVCQSQDGFEAVLRRSA